MPDVLDAAFAALSNPTRRAIIARLADGYATVNELVEPFSLSQPTISRHLKVLENAGLISRSRVAQSRPCHLETGPLAQIDGWLEKYREVLEANYVRLDSVLDVLEAERKNR
ncbi:MAG: metalloregulator ArsR/SmtB family transcription factor [Pseudomonadota bacterium]